MKNIFLLLLVSLMAYKATAQYKENKKHFYHKDYERQKGDPHSPLLAGVSSFIIPGLGQVIAGEPVRGLGYFAGYMVSRSIILNVGSNIDAGDTEFDNGFEEVKALVGVGGFLYTWIASTIDAVRVAKVNNMAFQEERKKISVQLEPTMLRYHQQPRVATGLKVSIQLK